MKKVIALTLAVLTAFSCLAVCASAADGDAPQTTPSGFYVGQQIKPGDELKSAFENCSTFIMVYSVDTADAENVTSAWQKKFCDDTITGVTTFRDNIASFSADETYKGVYTVKGQGDVVGEIETGYRVYQSATDIYTSMKEDELKAIGIRKEFNLTIDYEYAYTTYNQYTFITAWEITKVQDTESELSIRVKAVFETREPTKWEAFQEKMYDHWMAFLDKIGDVLLKIVPKMMAFWAKVLGKNR